MLGLPMGIYGVRPHCGVLLISWMGMARWAFDMSHLDKIIDFLGYHPGLSRPDIMARLNLGVRASVRPFFSFENGSLECG